MKLSRFYQVIENLRKKGVYIKDFKIVDLEKYKDVLEEI